jgi:hypothetical protein
MTDEAPHTIVGFKSEAAGCAVFTDAYNRNHDRGYEASMSACVHAIEFSPRVIKAPSIPELKRKVLTDPPTLCEISSISGRYLTLRCRKSAKAYYDKGRTPELITPK